jgi:hypothetical protein
MRRRRVQPCRRPSRNVGMRRALLILTAGLAVALPAEPAHARQDFSYSDGYAGTLPTDPRLLARTYFDLPSVRSLIHELEHGPVSRDRVNQALEGTDYEPADLVRVGLIGERDGGYALAFNDFTLEDMKAIHRVVEEHAPSLASAFTSRRDEFERIFRRYPVPSVSHDKLAFILISGFSLNWGGLQMTEQMGFRKPHEVSGKGWHYAYWVAADDPDYSIRGFYWGRSTFPAGSFNFQDHPVDFAFSSFGDPYSDPRMNLPDLLGLPLENMDPGVAACVQWIGTVKETHFGMNLEHVLGFERTYDLGTILFALRDGPKRGQDLAEAVRDRKALPAMLDLLVTIQYISRDDAGGYRLMIPVLDTQVSAMVDDALAASREVIRGWLTANYPEVRKELAGLVAVKQGVPFEALFTRVWHDLFGRVTKELAATGFTADPYGPDVAHKGSLGAPWRVGLVETPF